MEKLFPRFETMDDVRKAAREGGIAGLVFAGMVLLGGVFMALSGGIPGYDDTVTGGERMDSLIAIGIELALVLLFTWRLSTGKGYVSGILLLALFVLEIGLKLAGHATAFYWFILYAVLAWAIFTAIRASFAYKRVSSLSASVETF